MTLGTHDYVNARGELLFQTCRLLTNEGKRMWCRRPDPDKPGEYINSLDGIDARPLYALPDVLDAVTRGEQVHLVAGEKIADALHTYGYVGTTNPFGESGDLKPEQVEALRGARVAVWVDSDAPGRARGERAIDQLRDVVAELRGPIDLAPLRHDGYDLADAIEEWRDLGTVDVACRIEEMVDAAFVTPVQDDATPEPDLRIVVESLAESLENEPPEPAWIWRGYIAPTWITLLVGGPKAGKTTLLFALLDAVAKGEPLFGLETRSVGALILTEQNPSVLKSTVDNFGFAFDRERVRVMYRRRQPQLGWHELIDEAVTYCRRESIGILVIDTFQRWAGMERDNDAPETLAAITALERAAESGLAVLVNHHQRKAGGTHTEEVSGPQALAAGVDVVMSMRRCPSAGENARKIAADGRSMVTPHELTARLEDGRYEVVEDADDDRGSNADAVAAALVDDPGTYADLQLRTGKRRRAVEYAIAELLKDGRVVETQPDGRKKRFALSSASGHGLFDATARAA